MPLKSVLYEYVRTLKNTSTIALQCPLPKQCQINLLLISPHLMHKSLNNIVTQNHSNDVNSQITTMKTFAGTSESTTVHFFAQYQLLSFPMYLLMNVADLSVRGIKTNTWPVLYILYSTTVSKVLYSTTYSILVLRCPRPYFIVVPRS